MGALEKKYLPGERVLLYDGERGGIGFTTWLWLSLSDEKYLICNGQTEWGGGAQTTEGRSQQPFQAFNERPYPTVREFYT